MKALIIEDETPAQKNLARAIERNFDDIEIVGILDSIKTSVKWLKNPENEADIIFMDVELSDGMSFDIFQKVDIDAKVIITTAYDSYAVKAFKVNSIDYLMKPIDEDELREAVSRCRKLIDNDKPKFDFAALENAFTNKVTKEYKQRFAIKIGTKIVVVNTDDIAYFCSEEKNTFVVLFDGKRYLLDDSLDALNGILDPKIFFRISRACIASIKSIESVHKQQNGKIKLVLSPKLNSDDDVTVSRFRVQDFVKWLDDK